MSRRWQFFRFVYNRRPVVLQGVNLWSFNWKPVGITADIYLPSDIDPTPVPIYEIRTRGRSIFFAAYEALPNYWIFCAKDDPFDTEGCTADINPDPPRLRDYEKIPECMQGYF